MKFLFLATLLISVSSHAAGNHTEAPTYLGQPTTSTGCGEMEVWDVAMGMCMPLPMAGMPMKMFMVHGYGFGVQTFVQKPRGRNEFAVPNMFMADIGTSIGDHHYLNLDYMGTVEKWTFPSRGYPLLGQIGESQASGIPYLDAQHPHNSPVMGLTLSDTIRLNESNKDHLKVFFAPRGESGDGPIAFMHRPTGMANPDAPLGHHIAQDVGHISSTVIGGSLKLGDTRIEASTFNGEEPHPTDVNLPLGTPNSYALRLIEELTPEVTAMVSAAYVKNPEPDAADIPYEMRYSASLYTQRPVCNGWILHTSSIFGLITKYDHANSLFSFGEEFLLRGERARLFGRLEILERTPAELEIPALASQNVGRWISAGTLGYTHVVLKTEGTELGIGGSTTLTLLPSAFGNAYGSNTPWSGKLFIQFGGTGMWDL